MRIHGLLTVMAILIIAAGFVPQYMGDIGTLTGEHTGVMLADELGTIGYDFDPSFKDGILLDTLVMEYYDGTEYVTVTDEDLENIKIYYNLNNDESLVMWHDFRTTLLDLSGSGYGVALYNGAYRDSNGITIDRTSYPSAYARTSSVFSEMYQPEWSCLIQTKIGDTSNIDALAMIRNYGGDYASVRRLDIGLYNLHPYIRVNFTLDGISYVLEYAQITEITVSQNDIINIGVSFDGTTVKYYINGEYYSSYDDTPAIGAYVPNYALPVYYGVYTNGSAYKYDGIIHYDMFHNKALSSTEFKAIHRMQGDFLTDYENCTFYATYEYRDTFSPIATELFTVGFPVLGIVILVFVGASYLYNN